MVIDIELYESQYLTELDICWLGWINTEAYKR